MLSQKGFAPIVAILGILVVGLIGGGAAYYGGVFNRSTEIPKTDITSNPPPLSSLPQLPPLAPDPETYDWKAYTHSTLGFIFKYPSEWNLERTPNNLYDEIKSYDQEFDPAEVVEAVAKSGARILIPADMKSFGLESFSNVKEGVVIKGNDTTSDKRISNVKQFILDGQKAQQYDYVSTITPRLIGTKIEILMRDGKIYEIDMLYSSRSFKSIFDQILTTLKFNHQKPFVSPDSKKVKEVVSYKSPLNWVEELWDMGNSVVIYAPLDDTNGPGGLRLECSISILHRSFSQETHTGNLKSQSRDLKEIRDFTINGHPASSYLNDFGEGKAYVTNIADGPNAYIQISILTDSSPSFPKCKSVYEQFSKTVQFK